MADLQATGRGGQRALLISIIGIAAVLIGLLIVVIAFHSTSDPDKLVPAVLAPVLATIGTLVGAVAGHAAGGDRADAAYAESGKAQDRADAANAESAKSQA